MKDVFGDEHFERAMRWWDQVFANELGFSCDPEEFIWHPFSRTGERVIVPRGISAIIFSTVVARSTIQRRIPTLRARRGRERRGARRARAPSDDDCDGDSDDSLSKQKKAGIAARQPGAQQCPLFFVEFSRSESEDTQQIDNALKIVARAALRIAREQHQQQSSPQRDGRA
jgi:hypothetical protein